MRVAKWRSRFGRILHGLNEKPDDCRVCAFIKNNCFIVDFIFGRKVDVNVFLGLNLKVKAVSDAINLWFFGCLLLTSGYSGVIGYSDFPC